MDDFKLGRRIYYGKASSVYLAEIARTHYPVILKLYKKSRLSDLNRFQVKREVRLHINLCHENIITMYGAFEDAKYVVLVLEHANGVSMLMEGIVGRRRASFPAALCLWDYNMVCSSEHLPLFSFWYLHVSHCCVSTLLPCAYLYLHVWKVS